MDVKDYIDMQKREMTVLRADNLILQDKLNKALEIIIAEIRLDSMIFDETKDQTMVRDYHDLLSGLRLDSKGFIIGKGSKVPLDN